MALSTTTPQQALPSVLQNITIAGAPARFSTPQIQALATHPIIRTPTSRQGQKAFIPNPVYHSEAYMLQERGTIPPKSCDSCRRGSGQFDTCVVLAGFFSEGCGNCHYRGGRGNVCSFVEENEIAIAVATVAAMPPPPNVQFSAPANYYGGSLAGDGNGMAGSFIIGAAPLSTSSSRLGNEKRKRLAPINLGDSDTFHLYAKKTRGMSEEERRKERGSLLLQLAALTKV